MRAIFRGIELQNVRVESFLGKVHYTVYFTNHVKYSDRVSWLNAGYPLYNNPITHEDYFYISDLSEIQVINDPSVAAQVTKCECGSAAVGSNFHSSWCPKHA